MSVERAMHIRQQGQPRARTFDTVLADGARPTVLVVSDSRALAGRLRQDLGGAFDPQLGEWKPEAHQVCGAVGRAAAAIAVSVTASGSLAILRSLKAARPEIRVVVVMKAPSDDALIDAGALGADGLLVDPPSVDAVIDCLQQVLAGRLCLDRTTFGRIVQRLLRRLAVLRDLSTCLSQREREVVSLVSHGLTNKEIAARLFVSEGTVKVHLCNIFKKLDIRGRKALADYARDHGLV